ncbi:YdeI/OmpD-associated family protein [Angustibacter sp. McL0619]|uniref:YdeI/OmpD-associated family protein n=1 Tax=Angustibacter sp. McL0619 TaxID=3415676 RepID=UPI003CE9B1AC
MAARARLDPRFDAYVDPLPAWQQAICRRVRELALAADPEVVETIKRTVQPYYVLQGNVCALLAARGWVNVFIYSTLFDDPTAMVTGGQGNATGRTIAVHEGEVLDAEAFTAILRQVIANNRAGRKVSTTGDPKREVPVPAELAADLGTAGLRAAFDERPFYQRKHWVDSITSAKKRETRERRLQSMVEDLRTGRAP